MRLAFAGLFALALGQSPGNQGLIVHEWGTFTSWVSPDGLALQWRPRGPTDLPRFVCGGVKGNLPGTVRMETPVLYFYSDREMTVSARVDFPAGHITEWYPQARVADNRIEWSGVTVGPDAEAHFPLEGRPSRYYAARETAATPIRAGRQQEKFLFYRGVGTFNLPLAVRLAGDAVRMENLGRDRIRQVILFENREGRTGYRVRDLLPDEVVFDRPVPERTVDSLRQELAAILIGHGLYLQEANAMVKTWSDLWFGQGLRVFFLVPREMTDLVLPISIQPRPAALVRVLVGRIELQETSGSSSATSALSR